MAEDLNNDTFLNDGVVLRRMFVMVLAFLLKGTNGVMTLIAQIAPNLSLKIQMNM